MKTQTKRSAAQSAADKRYDSKRGQPIAIRLNTNEKNLIEAAVGGRASIGVKVKTIALAYAEQVLGYSKNFTKTVLT